MKRIRIIPVCAVALLGLTACGPGRTSGPAEPDDNPPVEVQVTETDNPDEAAASLRRSVGNSAPATAQEDSVR